MRIRARTIGIAAMLAALVVAFALRGSQAQDSPEHRTDNDSATGASALVQLAQALGHPTTTLGSDFNPDLGMGVLFVLEPTVGFTQTESQRAADYVAGGGTLVYASDQGDDQLDLKLNVVRQRGFASGDATGAGPMIAGVGHVTGATTVAPLELQSGQVILLRSTTGQAVAYEELIGRGRLVVLGDPLPLCNGYLQKADDGRLAADLVSLAAAGTRVGFDEFHHQAPSDASPLTAWLSTPWGDAVAWAVVLLFVGLLLRGRAFGPRLALPGGGGQRSTAEHVAAVGGLLQRSRSGELTGRLLAAATRRTLARRHGLAPSGDFERVLRTRAPAAADELAGAEAALDQGGRADAALVAAARRLHRLAYPEQPRT